MRQAIRAAIRAWGRNRRKATMARKISTIARLFAPLIVGAALIGSAHAQDCPRGDLDKAYCDRNGDLVADAPTDPKQLVNPSTLIFAYTPVEDPAVYAKAWDGFVKYMEQTTGKKVVFFPVQSNAAEIEAMRSGRLHVAGFNTGSNPIAVNCAGFVPFAIMGTKVAFTSPTSNSGFKAPSAILKTDFNLEANRDFTPVFSGKHDNSVIGVANKDYDAAAIANEVMFRMFERKVVDRDKIRSIYKSETFPTTGYGYAHNLDPALVEKIKQAFFTFPWEGSALKAEFKKEDRFIPITYKKDWSVIRKIDTATGVKYTCK